jgi:Fe-S-cluster containining protein
MNGMKEIPCQRCGKCCLADMLDYAAEEERERWRREGREDILQILDRHHSVWMGDHLVSADDGHTFRGCPFLEWEGGLTRCAIYETRPRVCRDFLPGSSEICPRFRRGRREG